jgi:hypothetical protein
MIGEMLQSSIVERITSPVLEHAVHHAVEAIQLRSMVKSNLSLIVQHEKLNSGGIVGKTGINIDVGK